MYDRSDKITEGGTRSKGGGSRGQKEEFAAGQIYGELVRVDVFDVQNDFSYLFAFMSRDETRIDLLTPFYTESCEVDADLVYRWTPLCALTQQYKSCNLLYKSANQY